MSSIHWRPLGLFSSFIGELPLHSLVSLLVEHRLVRILSVLRGVFWEVEVGVAAVHSRKLSEADPGPSAICLAAFIPLLRNNLYLAVNLGKGSKSRPSKQRRCHVYLVDNFFGRNCCCGLFFCKLCKLPFWIRTRFCKLKLWTLFCKLSFLTDKKNFWMICHFVPLKKYRLLICSLVLRL